MIVKSLKGFEFEISEGAKTGEAFAVAGSIKQRHDQLKFTWSCLPNKHHIYSFYLVGGHCEDHLNVRKSTFLILTTSLNFTWCCLQYKICG